MGKILSNESARRLQQLLYGPGNQPVPQLRHGGSSRIPVLVRCTSATAAGGTETGHDQCYPAKVLNVNSLLDEQEEEADVWLTVLDGGSTASPITIAVPVAGNAYYGLYSGTFDPFPGSGSSDPRQRVFATTGAGTGDANLPYDSYVMGFDHTISVQSTWQTVLNGANTVQLVLPSTGVYLLCGTVVVKHNDSNHGQISARLYDSTNSVIIPGAGAACIHGYAETSHDQYETGTFTTIYGLNGTSGQAVPATLVLQAWQNSATATNKVTHDVGPGDGTTGTSIHYARIADF